VPAGHVTAGVIEASFHVFGGNAEHSQSCCQRAAKVGHNSHDLHLRSSALALLGKFDEARRLQSEYHRGLEERGDVLNLGSHLAQDAAALELLDGNPAAAAVIAERGCSILEEAGERAWLSTGACRYAQALYELGRLEEAEEWARKGSDMGDRDDMATQIMAGQVRAKVLARRGQRIEAERLAREAMAWSDGTNSPVGQGDVRSDLAEVLELEGRREEATSSPHGQTEGSTAWVDDRFGGSRYDADCCA